jgi:hypothetical protein
MNSTKRDFISEPEQIKAIIDRAMKRLLREDEDKDDDRERD